MSVWWLLGGGVAVVLLAAATYLAYRHLDTEAWARRLRQSGTAAAERSTGIGSIVRSTQFKAFVALVFLFGGAAAALWLSWTYLGPIDTIVYAVLFLATATAFPVLIALFGSALPGSGMVGKLHGALGAFAYGGMALVQTVDAYRLCPARKDRVYIDGQWYHVDGQTNWSVLWWNRFGILRHKDESTLRDVRVDTKAERDRGVSADGGEVTRGGYAQATPPAVTGVDGTWVVDLKRVFSRGIKQIGDIELIETAEEITSRKHAKQGMTAGYEPILGAIVGIIIGVVTGWVLLGGV